VNADDLEVRFESILDSKLSQIDERLENIERRMYR
jgi:hypothetical protein